MLIRVCHIARRGEVLATKQQVGNVLFQGLWADAHTFVQVDRLAEPYGLGRCCTALCGVTGGDGERCTSLVFLTKSALACIPHSARAELAVSETPTLSPGMQGILVPEGGAR